MQPEEENKNTTWWKKVLLIVGVYVVWWSIFYGSILFIPQDFFKDYNDTLIAKVFVFIAWITVFLLAPLSWFYIIKKIINKTNINPRFMYIIATLLIIAGFVYFFLLSAMFLMHPDIG